MANISIVPSIIMERTSEENLAGVKALNGTPMGSSPYKFISYQDNIVTWKQIPYFSEIL